MKKILAILFSGVLLAGLPSCGDFLEEYSQTLSYVDDLSDLDELLIGGAYLEDRSQVCKYLWINYMDDDCKEEWFGPSEGKRPMDYIRGILLWERYPWWEDKSVVQNTPNRAPYGGNPSWQDLYVKIAVTNAVIEEVERFAGDSKTRNLYRQVKGSACFLRALYYFTLTNLWGLPYVAETASTDLAVPLKTESAIKAGGFSRNSVQELYDQIVKDLKMAVECLQPVERSNKLYANASAARLLLARCYLYMCDWAEARKWAGEVIADVSNATFRICNMNDFTAKTYETATTADRSLAWSEYIFLNGWQVILMNTNKCPQPSYSDELYGSYASNDLRKSYWFFKKSSGGNSFSHFLFQAKVSYFTPLSFTLPEAYLIEAEAAAMEDDWTGAAAALKTIRDNRIKTGMEDVAYETFTGQEMIDFIRAERRRELAFRGLRWYDLRRYAVLPKYQLKTTIRHAVYEWGDNAAVLSGYHELGEWPGDGGWVMPFPTYALQNNEGMLVDNDRPDRVLVQ